MTEINGYQLIRKADSAELARWGVPPGRIDLPNGDVVFGAGAGWENDTYSIGPRSWSEPDPVASVPTIISDRQFFQALAMAGEIAPEEALAAVKTGAIPARLQTFIDALPADQKFAAEMVVSGATIFDRNHPMTAALSAGLGWTAQQVLELWATASAL